MCFDLMQDQVKQVFRDVAARLGFEARELMRCDSSQVARV